MTAVSVAGYVAGIACLTVILTGSFLVGRAATRWFMPAVDRSLRLVVQAVLAVSFLLLTAQLLGTFGALSRWPLLAVTAVAGILATRPAIRAVRPRARYLPLRLTGMHAAATASVTLIGAEVVVAIVATGRTGIAFYDAMQYHLVWAAHFATSHSTTSYIHTGIGDTTTYYPLNDELLHGIAMIAIGRDTLSLLIVGLEMALTLLAVYAIGQRWDEGCLALCVVSPVVATLGELDASAPNDWAALWPFLAGVAVVVHALGEDRLVTRRVALLVGLCAGLGIGTKLTMLAPGILLGIVLVAMTRGRKPVTAGCVFGGGIVTGSFWLVRNLVAVGSPIPAERLPGLPRIPMSVTDAISTSVAHYATNFHIWRTVFAPDLRVYLGDAWPAVLALSAAGIIVALLRPSGTAVRAMALLAVAATAAYLVTPTTAGGPSYNPFFFVFNIRYDLPALSLGLLLVCGVRGVRRVRLPVALLSLGALVVQLTHGSDWDAGLADTGIGVAAALIASVTIVSVRCRHTARASLTLIAVAVLGVVVAGYPLQQRYLHDRYSGPGTAALTAPSLSAPTAQLGLYSSLTHISGVLRVGVVGNGATYPYLGPRWHNHVALLGQSLPHHAFENYDSCPAWRAASGSQNYIVIGKLFNVSPAALRWTESDPDAALVFTDAAGSVFRIDPGYATVPC